MVEAQRFLVAPSRARASGEPNRDSRCIRGLRRRLAQLNMFFCEKAAATEQQTCRTLGVWRSGKGKRSGAACERPAAFLRAFSECHPVLAWTRVLGGSFAGRARKFGGQLKRFS